MATNNGAQLSDAQQKAQGKVLRPGFSNPTPQWATRANRVIMALIGAYGTFVLSTQYSVIPENVQHYLNQILLAVPIITTFLKNAFGWDFPKDQNQ